MIGKIRFTLVAILFFIFSFFAIFVFIFVPKHPSNTYRLAKKLRSLFFWLLGIDVTVINEHYFYQDRPVVFIGNHQNALDVVLFGAYCPPRTVVIAKKELLYIPIFGQLFWLLGHFPINRKVHESAMDTMKKVKEKVIEKSISVIILPEGTRRYSKGLGKFKKGAFHLALGADIEIVPVVVSTMEGRVNLSRFKSGKILMKLLPPRKLQDINEKSLEDQIEDFRSLYQKEIDEVDKLF